MTQPYQPTEQDRKTVRAMTAVGIDQVQIAAVVGISDRTLRKHFRREITVGAAEANARVAMRLYEKALAGDTIAMIFWLKCRAHWKEPPTRIANEEAAPFSVSFQWADATPPGGIPNDGSQQPVGYPPT